MNDFIHHVFTEHSLMSGAVRAGQMVMLLQHLAGGACREQAEPREGSLLSALGREETQPLPQLC